ncbi:MAG TPA: hypothetical protein DCM40_05235 [Maribacter sp.]|nr:hypothetical protein [Maribacter sp.]
MENQTALQAAMTVAKGTTGFEVKDTLVKKETGKSITITQVLPDNKRRPYVQAANSFLTSSDDFEFMEVTSNRATKDFKFKIKNFDKIIVVQTKPDGKRGRTDPNELLTAGLACMSLPRAMPDDIVELDDMVDKVKELIPSTVKDYDKNEFAAIDGDYTNFCQALSAAIAIQKFCGGKGEKSYVTGRVWNKDIKKFKRNAYGMKDFNSSDIVIKRGKEFYGISLKKKDRSTTADPTLLNKAVSNLFASKDLVDEYNETLKDFMINKVVKNAEAKGLVPTGSVRSAAADRNARRPKWKQLVSGLPNKFFNDQLKGPDSIFGRIADMFEKEQDTIANKIMQLVLKTDLQELKDFNFHFALVTGIGRYGPKLGPVIEKAEVVPVDTVSIKVHELLEKGAPKIKVDKQSFTGNAAMLNMQLSIGNMPAINIAMRYKGSASWTSQPSVTAFLTREFKTFLKDV